jgi:chemotaxis protein methyltransferase CheR
VDGHCTARAAADPLDAAPYLYLALVAEQRGRYPEAVALIRKTLYADRSIAVAHYHLGILLRRSGELAAARLAYQNVGRHLAASERDPVPYADGLTVEDIRKLVALELAELGP